jgi:hypothetical protein
VNSAIQGLSADILKIALYRLWKWIHNSGLENDIRMLAPVHDEVFFEVKEDKLEALIPEICEIMRLKDIVEKFKWPVPLEVDAEYGDNWHVDHDFWAEHKKNKKAEIAVEKADALVPDETSSPEVPVKDVATVVVTEQNQTHAIPPDESQQVLEESLPKQEEVNNLEGAIMVSSVVAEKKIQSTTFNNAVQYYVNVVVNNTEEESIGKKESLKKILASNSCSQETKPLFHESAVKDRIDARGYFNYPLEIDAISARKLHFIFEILLPAGDLFYIGPRYKICVLSKDGEVYYRTSEAVSVDAFLALCVVFNI